jgi:peptidoglycan L-alanyl-D-glutamate endopeptidase CwlK
MAFVLSERSWGKLKDVHPDLVRVVDRAIELTVIDFAVTEGARTPQKQLELRDAGASRTLNSRHIPGTDGYAKAVDLAAFVGDEVRWDWPLYSKIADAMKLAAKELNVPIEWGGDWRTFKDGPHFQLPHKQYP